MLKFVTWDGDLTQFLVDAEDNFGAVLKAIKANEEIWKETGGLPDEDEFDSTHNIETYSVIDVDIKLLNEIFDRNDRGRLYGEAIVFWD